MADCIADQITHEQAVERGTHKKQAQAWRHWKEYIESIRIKNDDYLENFTREQRHTIIGAFALALQEARFSKPNYERLAAETVSSTVQYVCRSFQEQGYQTHLLTRTDALHLFYSKNLGHSKTPTQPKDIKQLSHSLSSQATRIRACKSNSRTCHSWYLLCNRILQIPQGSTS